MLNNYDFTFATSPEDVGMRTGATIHTMNGLNMNVRKLSKDAEPPATDGWWEKQHLKRGLSETWSTISYTRGSCLDHFGKDGRAEREGWRWKVGCPPLVKHKNSCTLKHY